jgi:transcriptional regulator with XRE-family HTH domain
LRMLRRQRDLSQELLARRSGMQAAVFSRIERHEVDPQLASLERIARALDVTMAELFDGVGWSIDR